MATKVLLLLASYTNDEKYRDAAIGAMKPVAPIMTRFPRAFGNWLCALDLHMGPLKEVAIVAGEEDQEQNLLDTVRAVYRPRVVVGFREPSAGSSERVPLLRNREKRDGKMTAYVCEGFSCKAPTTSSSTLAGMLE